MKRHVINICSLWKNVNMPMKVSIVLIVVIIFGGFYWITFGNMSLSSRYVRTIHEHVIYSEMFTASRITEVKEKYIGWQGDGLIEGMFLLSVNDMNRLMNAPKLIHCEPNVSCEIEALGDKGGELCYNGISEEEGINFRLCLYPTKNEASWSYGWY